MALHWATFGEQMPNRERDGTLIIAAYPGSEPFVLHWPTDTHHMDAPDCIWLVGARIPRVPQPHEVGCCCKRSKAA